VGLTGWDYPAPLRGLAASHVYLGTAWTTAKWSERGEEDTFELPFPPKLPAYSTRSEIVHTIGERISEGERLLNGIRCGGPTSASQRERDAAVLQIRQCAFRPKPASPTQAGFLQLLTTINVPLREQTYAPWYLRGFGNARSPYNRSIVKVIADRTSDADLLLAMLEADPAGWGLTPLTGGDRKRVAAAKAKLAEGFTRAQRNDPRILRRQHRRLGVRILPENRLKSVRGVSAKMLQPSIDELAGIAYRLGAKKLEHNLAVRRRWLEEQLPELHGKLLG
jgi:hypothetical protein